ncbi:MAG: hypothetical protein JWQ84_1079 [Mucilaginibacter sp.]|nr:hypothetical protein [Mucilaginibacter sp.]
MDIFQVSMGLILIDNSIAALVLKRCHIDDETVANIALNHTFVSSSNILDVYHFNVRNDIIFGTKIKHFLSFSYTANS